MHAAWQRTKVDDEEANALKRDSGLLHIVANAHDAEAKRLRAMR